MQTLLWKKRQEQLGRALFLQCCADAGCWARYDKAEIKRQQVVLSGDHCSATASLITCLELHPLKNTPCAFSAGHCQEMSPSSFTASSWGVFQCWALTNKLPSGFLSPPSTSSLEAMHRLNWDTVRLQGKWHFTRLKPKFPWEFGSKLSILYRDGHGWVLFHGSHQKGKPQNPDNTQNQLPGIFHSLHPCGIPGDTQTDYFFNFLF